MKFTPPLKKATLITRYKRFLADVTLDDGTVTTMHVANTGAMSGCADQGDIVWYSTAENIKRKYPLSWELCQKADGALICVNTLRANQLIEEAIKANAISELTGYQKLQREVKYGEENSRIDFHLSQGLQPEVFVEVKSVTLLSNQQGYFPDAISERGQKHLRELMQIVAQGKRAVLLFAVLHSDIKSVRPATHIDPRYGQLLVEAQRTGVEIIAYRASMSAEQMLITDKIACLVE